MSFRTRNGGQTVDVGPKAIVVRERGKEVRTVDLDEVTIDVKWRPSRQPREGAGEIEAYVFHPIDDFDNEIVIAPPMGYRRDDLQGAWETTVEIIKEHAVILENDLLLYFKYSYRLGLRTGLEDYWRVQHSKALADPKAERGELLLWSAWVWSANATVGEWVGLLAALPFVVVLATLVSMLESRYGDPIPLTPYQMLAVFAAVLGLGIVVMLHSWRRRAIRPYDEVPGLYANGLQLGGGRGFVPYSEMRRVQIHKGDCVFFNLNFGRWPDGELDEHSLLEDAHHTFPLAVLGREGLDTLLRRLDRSQIDEDYLPIWEERAGRSRVH